MKLAVGSGEGESFPIDLKELTSNFNLELIECYQALKILETNGNILFSESVFNPTKVKFAVGNTTLYSFQVKYDSISNLITLLSRSYPGIFDQYQEIHETEFCKRLQITQTELTKQLKFLESNGILDITWKTDKPIVTYIEPRQTDDYLRLKPEIYHERKKLAELRWQRMRNFLTQPICRALYLIEYFGQVSEPCGKCDYCNSLKKSNYSINELQSMVLINLNSPKSLYDLQTTLHEIPINELLRILQYLLQEEAISFENEFYKRN